MLKIKVFVEREYFVKKKRIIGVRSIVYKFFEGFLLLINFLVVLLLIFLDIILKFGDMRIWLDENKNIELVESKYGLVLKGFVLFYR